MKTNIGLKPKATQQIAQILSVSLADTFILYTKTLNFHWNMVDPRFIALHKLLEEQYEELQENIDELAERIRKIGEKAPATLKEFLALTVLKEPKGELSGNEMLKQLVEDNETIIQGLRKKIKDTQDLGDEGTADLFIQLIRAHEKAAWMLRSHFTN